MDQPLTNDLPAPMAATMEVPTEIKRHPIRGFLWGIVTGIGLSLLLVILKVITLSIVAVAVTIIVVALLATIWGLVGPAKQAKGPIPVTITPNPPPPLSRFDDFSEDVVADHHTGEPISVEKAASTDDTSGSEITPPAGERISEAPAAQVDESADDVAGQSGDEGEPTSPDAR